MATERLGMSKAFAAAQAAQKKSEFRCVYTDRFAAAQAAQKNL